MKEIWKDVVWYEGYYYVSNLWNIKWIKRMWSYWQILKQSKWNSWYFQVSLCVNGIEKIIMTHRIVAKAFVKNPYNKKYVNHIDWNKENNNAKNLSWVTASENDIHAYKIWLRFPSWSSWKDNSRSKKIWQYTLEWKLVRFRYSNREPQRELWFIHACIWNCCLWKQKTAYGFIWKYI